jgi:hypothetical protein
MNKFETDLTVRVGGSYSEKLKIVTNDRQPQ